VLYGLMSTALSDLAHHLVDQTLSDGDRAAPTFEAFDFSSNQSKDLASLCERVALGHPELETVCSWISEVGATADIGRPPLDQSSSTVSSLR
jgi:hypothetical protein